MHVALLHVSFMHAAKSPSMALYLLARKKKKRSLSLSKGTDLKEMNCPQINSSDSELVFPPLC
ncbi:MAG TPA: hypothetical protein DCZ76_01315 [Treponema sp.]|nr:hypothetical protein [Treponema sp.]